MPSLYLLLPVSGISVVEGRREGEGRGWKLNLRCSIFHTKKPTDKHPFGESLFFLLLLSLSVLVLAFLGPRHLLMCAFCKQPVHGDDFRLPFFYRALLYRIKFT